MIPGSANPLLLATADAGGYTISRSLRFNSADSAVLSRTFGTPTTQNTFTLSLWVKRAALGTTQQLFGVSTNHSFGFTSGNALNLTFGGVSALTTTAVFRDPSAWYHLVWRQNGTSHTLYVNNTSVGTATATSSTFNTAVAHQIAAANSANYFSGYLSDIHFIDGQALDPTSFGEFSATTGVWMPKAFTGSYGTNGFKLDFADNSAATAAALGKDTSGNGNNFTPTNLSVTAGAGNDSLIDVPVNGSQTDTGVGGEVRGNYATWNPLSVTNLYGGALAVLSNGNLDAYAPVSSQRGAVSTIELLTKCYSEFVSSKRDASVSYVGIRASSSNALYMWYGTNYYNNGTNEAVGTSYTTGDVVGITYDPSNGELKFYKNGSLAFTKTVSTAVQYVYYVSVYNDETCVANFGQRPFAYTAPSGFKALCTANLPAPTIVKPSTVMDVVLYTADVSGGKTISMPGGFSPDLVWIKNRDNVERHYLIDKVRGDSTFLNSNTTDSEAGATVQLNGTSLTLGNSSYTITDTTFTQGEIYFQNRTYASWCWDAGSSTVSNTAGTITSSVRANASAGFSVVTYTGTGANATVGHGLGIAPGMVVVKRRDTTANWQVRHTSIAAANSIQLNLTNAAASATTVWNSTAPSSTVFSIGTDATVNASGGTYVAYCFAPVAGYSAFGSYTGNGSADGPFVYTGFRPRWVMVKRTDSTSNWTIIDTAREGYNVDNDPLYPNLVDAEGTTDLADILSNGFKLRSTDASVNASSGTYVYAAFSEAAFQYSRAR